MKAWEFFATLVLSVACLVLSAAAILTVRSNLRLQQEIQTKQTLINDGVLGQQGRQITGSVLQEMANVAGDDDAMRDILTRHGYTLSTPNKEPPVAGKAQTPPSKKGDSTHE